MVRSIIDQFVMNGQRGRWAFTACLAIGFAVTTGCSGDSDGDLAPVDAGADTGVDVQDGGIAPDAGRTLDSGVRSDCQPALSATATAAAVLPLDLYTVQATGGTGAYRFAIVQNQSGSIINELSGAFLSGATQGTMDLVEITDDGCIGSARVSIAIVEQIELRPRDATVPPRTSFQFRTTGGTGRFAYRLIRDGTGATLTEDGTYTAGGVGIDRVEVRDTGTGEVAEATLTVVADAQITADPPVMYVPVGETYALEMNGGSGFVEVVGDPANFRLDDGRQVVGVQPGRVAVTLRDQFTGQVAPLTVEVVPDRDFDRVRGGLGLLATSIRTPGDLNGDGRPDLVIANPEASVEAAIGGAVFVYAGNANGFDPVPVQTIASDERSAEFGRSIAIADFDGDGNPDLAVGAPRSDVGGGDRGIVEVYRGIANGFFESQPYVTLGGNFGGDLLGWAMTSCDYNDDGLEDLAIGAYNAEDRTRSPQSGNQGGVFVFLGHSGGFRDVADQFLWGDIPDGNGGWNGRSNMHFGIALASGDHDGNGVCDLAAGTFEYDVGTANTNDGLVYVFAGVARTDENFGGLEMRPARAWASLDPANRTSNFARNIAMGDLNMDGKSDLVVGQFRYDNGNSDNHGAVRMFWGWEMNGQVGALAPDSDADWSFIHEQSNDYVGFAVEVGEATGDGIPDIIVGSYLDEVLAGNEGTVKVFAGRRLMIPDREPSRTITGLAGDDRLGTAVAAPGDLDGDGMPEIAAFAYYSDSFGRDVGTPYIFPGDTANPVVTLEYPGEASGMRFGHSAAIVGDVTGDGFEDLVVTAPYATNQAQGLFVGRAFLYRGSATGFETTAALTFEGMRRHSPYDYFGWSVSPVGDFDRDGSVDFAIVSRYEDKSATSSYGNEYRVDAGCPTGTQNDAGAVYIFRGSASGLPSTQPSFIIYGPQVGQTIREVRGGFDYNGDGFSDIAISAVDWDRPGAFTVGGVGLVPGRPQALAETTVVCGPDLVLLGNRSNDQLGLGLTALGDLDGDGCDEVAAGAPFEDAVISNEGGIRVLFGFGGSGCPSEPRMVGLRSGLNNAWAGYALAGGVDVTGDSVPDLTVGMPNYNDRGSRSGAVAVVSGAALAALPREPVQDDTRPTYQVMPIHGLVPGELAGEQFGRGVAMFTSANLGLVAAGSPFGNEGGVNLSGGVRVFAWTPNGPALPKIAGFSGETVREGSLLGIWLSSGELNGRPQLVVTGYWGNSASLDSGSAYVLDVAP